MIKGYLTEITNTYEKIRYDEKKALDNRKEEISTKYPEIMDLFYEARKLNSSLPKICLSSPDEATAEKALMEVRSKVTDIKAKMCEMLVERGYPSDYLSLKYRCEKCKDTGYINNVRCSCFKEKLVKLYYKNSGLEKILKTNNFSNYDINLFSSHKIGMESFSPRKNMEKTLDAILSDYLPNFKHSNTNLLFYGTPGSGKSFLSYCIACDLLEQGFLVVYKTSDELIRDLRDIKFNNNFALESLLMDCDLLIIDDLGAEQINDFSTTELFNLLNQKLLANKKMLISTNLTLPDITKLYSERISSRLIGSFKLYKFYSDDLRIKLNLQRKN